MGCLKLEHIDRGYLKKINFSPKGAVERKGNGKFFRLNTSPYGFNGMEADNEVSGQGNSYTTQFRQYDPRLGRWKSLDPLMRKYPGMSPYVAFNNNPVYFIDPFGLEGVPAKDDGPTDDSKLNGLLNDIAELAQKNGSDKLSYAISPKGTLFTNDGSGEVQNIDEVTVSVNLTDDKPDATKGSSELNYFFDNTLSSLSSISSNLKNANNYLIYSNKAISVNRLLNLKFPPTFDLKRVNGTLNGNRWVSGVRALKNANYLNNTSKVLSGLSFGSELYKTYETGNEAYVMRGMLKFSFGRFPIIGNYMNHQLDLAPIDAFTVKSMNEANSDIDLILGEGYEYDPETRRITYESVLFDDL